MKLPFTPDQFVANFSDYNTTVFPAQWGLYLLAVLIVYLAIRNTRYSDRIIATGLSLLWLWMGIVYQLVFFTRINNAAYLFGTFFIMQGVLFIYYGWRGNLSFSFDAGLSGWSGIVLVLFALFIYPAWGNLNGHIFPAKPTFGLPCPTTIYTFGVLLMSHRRVPLVLLIIPFLWAIIGFSATFSLGIKEDISLLIAGAYSAVLFVIKYRAIKV